MGYVTREYLQTQFTNFATRISTVFAKLTDIPTKLSDLTNDEGYIKYDTDNLSNYYKKSETYTKEEIAALTGGGVSAKVFDTKAELDTWIADTDNTATLQVGQNIYIVETDTPDYWWDGTQLQELETSKVDLSGYATTEDLKEYVKTTDVETDNIDFSEFFALDSGE